MTEFPIESFTGVGPLRFGMKRKDAHLLLGVPDISKRSRFAPELTDFWRSNGLQLVFELTKDELVEISLNPNLPRVTFGNFLLFTDSDDEIFKKLCALDGDPRIVAGVIVLLRLGISMSGFLLENDNSKSVTAFAQSRWDPSDRTLKPLA